ncbi:MAG: hypothetical protein R3F59_11435 [Myxococcota bacterium]
MRRWWFAVPALALAACGPKNGATGPSSKDVQFAGGFVDFDFSEEQAALDEMTGAEIDDNDTECGDLVGFETTALMGELKRDDVRCLDDAIRTSDRQTQKGKISRVLLNDAWARGEEHRWEALARRHLMEIDRSDPDMCYRFAYYLIDRGPEKMDEAQKWAQVALDNRRVWEGDLYVKRVYALMKIKTLAAQKKWTWLESEYARKPSEDLSKQATEARNDTKTLAREWLEYALGSGTDATAPLEICRSAAGTGDYCEGAGAGGG